MTKPTRTPALMPTIMRVAQAAAWMQGARHVGADVAIARVHTDTRTLAAGDLFVALQGERFDANDFLQQAKDQGAAAVVCRAGMAEDKYPAGLPRIEVSDTLRALGQLAAAWRAQFAIPVIAVTGSNGKTTVTQMLAAILEAHAPNGAALATRGNLNNAIGVPLTVLRLNAQHRLAVVELGMNHPGEIAELAAIAQPTVALVNNAQREHLEFMHTVEAVAQENGSVFQFLPANGTAVFPTQDAYAPVWRTLAGQRRVLGFGTEQPAADALACVRAEWVQGAWQVQAEGVGLSLAFRLNIAGRHNVRNALAAAACAHAAGVPAADIAAGLQAFSPVKGRSRAYALSVQRSEGARSITVVDDTYNANPDSVRAAIDVLAELPGPSLLVLGDMGEVGAQGPAFHAEAGQYARAQGIGQLLALGDLSQHAVQAFGGSACHFDSMEALLAALPQHALQAHSILVKGSRFMRMERVVDGLQAETLGAQACC